VRLLVSMVVGGIIGFLAAFLAIAAVVLLFTGVAGGILIRERPGTARVLNYDPSDVVLKAGVTGAASIVVFAIFFVIVHKSRPRRHR
jgi:disulfide bond formation protein DsbB